MRRKLGFAAFCVEALFGLVLVTNNRDPYRAVDGSTCFIFVMEFDHKY